VGMEKGKKKRPKKIKDKGIKENKKKCKEE
jgi:hypothetical protein